MASARSPSCTTSPMAKDTKGIASDQNPTLNAIFLIWGERRKLPDVVAVSHMHSSCQALPAGRLEGLIARFMESATRTPPASSVEGYDWKVRAAR